MIKIKIKQTKRDCLIEVHGHAHYAPIGKDIVCSAISVLFATLANSIDMTSDAFCRYDSPDENYKTLYTRNGKKEGSWVRLLYFTPADNCAKINPQPVCSCTEEAYPECVELRDV